MQDVAREQGQPFEPDRSDNLHRLNMGMFPQGASIIANPFNKIPGFFSTANGKSNEMGEREGIHLSARGPSQGASAPSGGSDPHVVGERGGIFFLPGFPVMAWPMMEWVLDTYFSQYFARDAWLEQSVVVFGAMESTLTPLMEDLERQHAVKVFSLPSVDHPQYGRHIELGVKGAPGAVGTAFAALVSGLRSMEMRLGPELVRK
jgi:molybdopterin-biosynthesis enzyme MoeA-like protein